MTSGLCEETILKLVNTYPFLRTEVLTTTAFGRPARTLTIGEGDRKVIYSAAHHANEWITTPVILKFVEELAEAVQNQGRLYGVEARNIVRAATIHTVPMVDPDGVDLVTGAIQTETLQYGAAQRLSDHYPLIPFPEGWKANLLGVDLNLQYPAGVASGAGNQIFSGIYQTRPPGLCGTRAPEPAGVCRAGGVHAANRPGTGSGVPHPGESDLLAVSGL